jgi:sulfur carrier protein ThiS
MKLVVNKKKCELPEGVTVLDLIRSQKGPLNDPGGVLCIVNGRISSPPYDHELCEGDEVRILVIPSGG